MQNCQEKILIRAIRLSNLFVDFSDDANNLLLKMRQEGWSTDKPSRSLASLSSEEENLLHEMEKAGLIARMS